MDNRTGASEARAGQLPGNAALMLARLVPNAFGVALGTVVGLLLFAATTVLVVRGGEAVGPHLELLSWFLPAYRVTLAGAVLGAGYGFLLGYAIGFLFATVRNFAVAVYIRFVWSRLQHHVASDLLDRMS